MKDQLAEAIDAARSLSYELFPPVLQRSGLPSALAWLADWTRKKHGLQVELRADPLANSGRKDIRTLLLESVRELLFNAVKHARVDRVTVDLTRDPNDMLRITVTDQGVGFDPALIERAPADQIGLGLLSIRERLTLLGGRFEIESAPGRGARFLLTAPRAIAPGSAPAPSPSSPAATGARSSGAVTASIASPAEGPDRRRSRRHAQGVARVASGASGVADRGRGRQRTRGDCPGARALARCRRDGCLDARDGRYRGHASHSRRVPVHSGSRSLDPSEQLHGMEAGAERFFIKGADTESLVDHLLSMHKTKCGALFPG